MYRGSWRLMPEIFRPAPGQGRELTEGWPFASRHEPSSPGRSPIKRDKHSSTRSLVSAPVIAVDDP